MTHESITKAVIKGHKKMLEDCVDILPGTQNRKKPVKTTQRSRKNNKGLK